MYFLRFHSYWLLKLISYNTLCVLQASLIFKGLGQRVEKGVQERSYKYTEVGEPE